MSSIEELLQVRKGMLIKVIIVWDNVALHHSHAVTEWFAAHLRMMSLFLPPYSPFLIPIEEFCSSWRWKVYDHQPHDQMSLLDAMNAVCLDISLEDCQGWIRHAKQLFCPRWHTMWCGWESVTKCSTIDYDFYQCIYKFLHFGITYKNENILKHTASCLIHFCNIYLAVNSSPK